MLSQPPSVGEPPRAWLPTDVDSVTPVNFRSLRSLLPVTGSVYRPSRTIESQQPVFSSSGRPPACHASCRWMNARGSNHHSCGTSRAGDQGNRLRQ
ncbi:hypothetical protein VTN00DRAFT_4080 [Thermoascus crustaceus]|uniref:uncharacterized protein n=1 Tax=Thermoascus crustaceus TaxID=5088 RepID=UPI00374414D5